MADDLAEGLISAAPRKSRATGWPGARLSTLGSVLLGVIALLWFATGGILAGDGCFGACAAPNLIGWQAGVVLIAIGFTGCIAGIVVLDGRTQRAEKLRDVLAAALNACPAPIQIKDASMRYVWANDAFAESLSCSGDQLIGRTVQELGLDPLIVEGVVAGDRQVLETRRTVGPVEQLVPAPGGMQKTKTLVTKVPFLQAGAVTHILTFSLEMPGWRDTRLRLEESHRLLESVMDAAPITIQLVDRDMRLRWVNRAFQEIFGAKAEDLIGKSVSEFTRMPERLAETLAANRDLLSGRRSIVETYHHYPESAGRPERHLHVIKAPIRGASGAVEQIITIGTDITAQRRAEAETAKANRLIEGILNSMPLSVQVKDRDLRYRWANQAFANQMGFDATDIPGKTVAEMNFTAEGKQRMEEGDRAVIETGETIRFDDRWVNEGEEYFINVIKAPIWGASGAVEQVITIGTDITAQRRAEAEAATVNRMIESILDHVPLSIQIKDRDLRYRWANRTFAAAMGRDVADILGRTIYTMSYDDENKRIMSDADHAVFKSGEKSRFTERRVMDGVERWWNAIKVPIVDADGCVTHVMTISDDFTEYRKLREEADTAHRLIAGILQNVPLNVMVKDRDLRYRWANQTLANLIGADVADIPGKTIHELNYSEEDKRILEDADRAVFASGETMRFPSSREVGGVEHWWNVIKVPIADADGRITHVVTIADDITEQRRLRNEADTANRLVAGILQNVPLSIQVKDRDLRYRWANRTFGDSVGRNPEHVLGLTVRDLGIDEIAKANAVAQDNQVLATGDTIRFNDVWLHDGTVRQMMVTKAPMRDADGHITHVIGIGVDVSELYRLRQEADEVRRRLQLVLDAVPVAIALKDLEGRYVWLNRQFERFRGKAGMSEAIGQPADDFLQDAVLAEEVRLADERLLRTGEVPPPMAQRLPVLDGDVRDYTVRRLPVRDAAGRIEGILVVGVDVTDLQQVTNELREVNADLEHRVTERARELAKVNELVSAVLEAAPVPIITRTLDGRVTSWNEAASRATGYAAHEAMQGHEPALAPDAHPTVTATRGEAFSNVESRRRHKNGREIEFLESGAPLRNADGVTEGIVSIWLDVTEQRATARQLQQAQKMEAVGQLTGGIAHDFNNLLAVVIGALDLLALDLPADGDQHGLVEQAIEAAERGAGLTSRLLAFSRRQALHPSATDVETLVNEITPLLQRAVGDTITIRRSTATALWPALIDQSQLESAILNLAVNARDAMPAGGTLSIDIRNEVIGPGEAAGIEEATEGDYIRVTVSDTGTGIPPEIQARVFDPFFTTKEVGKGSGLGLSMVLGFVKQSGGHVRLTSSADAGTSIALFLPRATEAAAGRAARNDPRLGTGETILVVEDDPRLRDVTAATVTALGYTVVSAADEQTALAALDAHPEIALLFSDIVLGSGANGFELARKARSRRPDLPVLFVSGFVDPAVVSSSHGDIVAGTDMLAKPFRREDLAQKLRASLGVAAGGVP